MKKARSLNAPIAGRDGSCPCCSGVDYATCCARFHQGAPAPTAEHLMRARYSAYVLHDNAFIAASWHASTRPEIRETEPDPQTRWLGLEVRQHAKPGGTGGTGGTGDTATVEFVARFKTGGRAQRLHEVSRFVQEVGFWWYVDGSFPKEKKQ